MVEFFGNIPDLQMYYCLAVIALAIFFYANSKISMELTSVLIIAALLVFYYYFPLLNDDGENRLNPQKIFMGFSNSALLTVISLLIIGQAIIQTGMLNNVAGLLIKLGGNNATISIAISLIFVLVISSILNNTPVVVIFIPIMAMLAKQMNISVSKVMIPLSFASILGGMTTLIGSSTNLLVSGVLQEIGMEKLDFFEFTFPGIYLAAVGIIFVMLVVPFMLKDRASFVKSYSQNDNRQFIAQIEISYDSDLVGKDMQEGTLPDFPNISVKMILRGEHAILAPFDDNVTIRPKDLIIVTASKKELTDFFGKNKDFINSHLARLSEEDEDDEQTEDMLMAEIVVAPGSRVLNQNLEQLSFHRKYDCTVIAIQRQSRMLRTKISEIRLAPGDVLLVMGSRESIFSLQETKDFLLMEWSAETVQTSSKALPTAVIFGSAVAMAGFNILPISIGAFLAVGLCLLFKCLTLNQAIRAIDMRIILMIAASLAMGTALQETGGAKFLANGLIDILEDFSPILILTLLFAFMVIMTNILSNNATAVLFTPIAINLAQQLSIDPKIFIYAVIFACNCSFVTPIGYQTNLMVMGPGHYKFSDFTKAGLPLAAIIMITYILYAWIFYF